MLLNIMGTKYVSSKSKETCTKLVWLRICLLLRWVIRQSVWRGHGGNVMLKRSGTDPHCFAIILLNTLPPCNYPPHGKGLPHASIKIVYDLLPHLHIGMIRTQIPTTIVSKYEVTQQIFTIGIPRYQLRSYLKEQHTHLIHNHITSTIKRYPSIFRGTNIEHKIHINMYILLQWNVLNHSYEIHK